MSPTRALPLALALAVLPAQAVRAQAHLAVEERILTERIHQDLSDVLDNASQDFELEPGSIQFSKPESTKILPWTLDALFFVGLFMTADPILYVVAYELVNSRAAPPVGRTRFIRGVSGIFITISSFIINDNIDDFINNRMEVHYALEDPDGEIEDGSCLAFFALGENPDGSHDLHYALDACSHDDVFPQAVPAGNGDVRIGPDGVDVWDSLLGQTQVVAKGIIPVSAQTVHAQAHLVVDRHVLVERRVFIKHINRDLSELLQEHAPQHTPTPKNFFWGGGRSPSDIRNTTSQYSLVPKATRLSYPESTLLPTVVAAPMVILIPKLAAATGGTMALAVLSATYALPSAIDILHARYILRKGRAVNSRDPTNTGNPFFIFDFFYNRTEVHYLLEGSDGEIEDGSCLAFFALGENPDGGRDFHYALDACSHDDIFPQDVPMGDGDVRIGSDGVDMWDSLLGQTQVVAKGSIPVPAP